MKDPYVYKNGTLINLLDITDYEELKHAEADIGFLRLINVDSVYKGKCDEELLKNIHRHIFDGIYEWAGEYRKTTLYKEEKVIIPGASLDYAHPKELKKKLKDALLDLNKTKFNLKDIDELSIVFAKKLAGLWKIHPFRDGNTRTFLSFAYIFAKEHGFPFDIKVFINELTRKVDDNGRTIRYNVRDKFLYAALDEEYYPEVEHLALMFKTAILAYQNNNEINYKK